MKDVGSLYGEGLFLFFWQTLVECTPRSLTVNQTYRKRETERLSQTVGGKEESEFSWAVPTNRIGGTRRETQTTFKCTQKKIC